MIYKVEDEDEEMVVNCWVNICEMVQEKWDPLQEWKGCFEEKHTDSLSWKMKEGR